MIRILPIPPDDLPAFCREKGVSAAGPLRGCTSCEGETPLGWCLVAEGDPCLILGVEAEDGWLADGLLRAALFPLYEGGAGTYSFREPPSIPLPERYDTTGTGRLATLFAPCKKEEDKG